jgi:hypothetical protein
LGVILLTILVTSCGNGGGAPQQPSPPLGDDASLSSLTISDGTLNPAFVPSLTDYAASVPRNTDSVVVSVTTSDSDASVTINGGADTSISLDVGENTINILVTAENGTATRTYTVVITRLASDNANLSNIELSNATLEQSFDPAVLDYETTVDFLSDRMQVTVTADDENANIKINGKDADSGVASEPIVIDVGSNTITINVLAEDGTTAQTYTVVVIRQSELAFVQTAYVKASNTNDYDVFGYSVALSGDGRTLAIGAPAEGSAATGVNGDQADNSAGTSGAVYVFARDTAGTWSQQAYVKASNTDGGDQFGRSVAMSGDGSMLAIGAPFEGSSTTGVNGDQADNSAGASGAVYVFARDTAGTWSQQAYIKASNTDGGDRFGWSVAMSGDGSMLATGAPFEGGLATGINGDQANNTASSAGAVYIFSRDSADAWGQEAYVKASNTDSGDNFGSSVTLSGDGSMLATGAPHEGSAATGINGDQADNTASSAGAVYVFSRDSADAWSQEAYVKASNTDSGDNFGSSVTLSGDGSMLATGAPLEGSAATGVNGDQADNSAGTSGAVYVFARDTAGTWSQEAYVKASNTDSRDYFGFSITLSGDGSMLVTGAPFEDSLATGVNGDEADNTANDSGANYVFWRNATGTWTQQVYVKASNTTAGYLCCESNGGENDLVGDYFGVDVSLARDSKTLAVGAYWERSAATGVNGDQTDTSLYVAGAAYIFEL